MLTINNTWEIGLLLREIEALKKRLDTIEYELSGQWYVDYRNEVEEANGKKQK